MPGLKTNEIPGTRAVLRHSRMSAYKVREVLDIIRGKEVALAAEILRFSERDAAHEVGKLLASAVANAENNDQMDPEELYVSTCYADEGGTIKRWRPRARGRASRIRKRTCHVTVIVSRLPEDRLQRVRARQAADLATRRARRVAGQRQSQRPSEADQAELEELAAEAVEAAQIEAEEGIVDEQAAAVAAVESATPEELSALPPSAQEEPASEVAMEESSTEPGGASPVESTEEGE
ncbi:MAG: 50S ribosomal protein L22 [Acidimicrobiales bacterium]